MRSLHRRGVEVCCFDVHADYPAFRSVYGPAYLCPNPDTNPKQWLDFMIELSGRLHDKPVLIPSADQFVSAIAEHASELSQYYVLSQGVPVQGMLATKQTQYKLAIDHGMPLPYTKLAESEGDVTEFAGNAVFPCLLKPIHFREWQTFPVHHELAYKKIAIAESADRLLAIWRLASVVNPNVVLQEIIQGPDSAKRVYVSCHDRSHRRIAHAMFRELRCDPLGFGPATVSEPIVDPETEATCERFLRAIEYSGVCEFEMKWDARDGQVKLIEANPRLTGGGDAAPYAGVDTCWLHYLDLIGEEVQPVAPSGRDFRHIVLRSDLSAIVAYRRAGLVSWRDVFRSYRPPLAFFDLDRNDWRYSAATIYHMLRSAIGKIVRVTAGKETFS